MHTEGGEPVSIMERIASSERNGNAMGRILYTVAAILVALWLIGLIVHVAFWAIHLLLVVAVILFVWNLLMGRRRII